MFRNTSQWTHLFEERDALWIHGGNPKQPHVILHSGKHSSAYFMAKLVTEDDTLRSEMVSDLLDLLIERGFDVEVVDRIVGPATGATKLAVSLAAEITKRRGRICRSASLEKLSNGANLRMVFKKLDDCVQSGENVLIIEDAFTTGSSVRLAQLAVVAQGGICPPYVLTLMNRSGRNFHNGYRVISLVNRYLPIWDGKDDCQLCSIRSEAILPKEPASNWERLKRGRR